MPIHSKTIYNELLEDNLQEYPDLTPLENLLASNKKVTIYETITFTASNTGTVTIPTGGTIDTDYFGAGDTIILSTVTGGIPNFVTPRNTLGEFITGTIDSLGQVTISETITGSLAVIYGFDITSENYSLLDSSVTDRISDAVDIDEKSNTHYHVVRINTTFGVAPSGVEVPNPIINDTATVLLNSRYLEFWSYDGTSWSVNQALSTTRTDLITLLTSLGTVKTGVRIVPNNNLTFQLTAGTFTFYSSVTDEVPTPVVFANQPTVTFRYFTPNGSIINTNVTDIDPDQYWNGVSLVATPNNDWTQQSVLVNQSSGDVLVGYGSVVYANNATARSAALFENIEVPASLFNLGYVLVGSIIVREDIPNLQTNNTYIRVSNKFGELIA